ncbi:MAG: pentapeptide repeat-containing protein [Paracoccaceae bacterium]|uniref:pentapeptide repeat-containing protein n=1 Tax=Roseibium sp. TaxID=1936156 RepID=UPI003296B406
MSSDGDDWDRRKPLSAAERRDLSDAIGLTESTDVVSVLGDQRDVLSYLFRHAWLASVRFDNQTWSGTDFTGSDLAKSSFEGASIRNARFDFAIVDRVQLRAARDWPGHVALELERVPLSPDFLPVPEPGRLMAERAYAPQLIMPEPLSPDIGSGDNAQLRAWRAGCLAIAASCVRQDEWSWMTYRPGAAVPDRGTENHAKIIERLVDAENYTAWLSSATGGRYEIMDSEIYETLCQVEDVGQGAVPDSDYIFDQREPAPYPETSIPGAGRCSKSGFLDLIGNLRQITTAGDDDFRLVGGSHDGSYRAKRWWSTINQDKGRDWGLRVVRIFPDQPRGT